MRELRQISLRPNDIQSYKSLGKQVTPMELSRFKSLTEGSCIPLHINQDYDVKTISIFLEPRVRLRQVDNVHMRAIAMSEIEKRKHGDEWKDAEKLALKSISTGKKSVTFVNNTLLQSEIIALRGLSFRRVAMAGGFRLDTQAHIMAMDYGHPVILVGRRRKKPGEPSMESKALRTPIRKEGLWTLAASDMVGAENLGESPLPEHAWIRNMLQGFDGNMGIQSFDAEDREFHFDIKYIGTTIDLHMSVGVTGILGLIDTNLSPDAIDNAKGDSDLVLDTVSLDMASLCTFLQFNRDNMVPQLITGLVMLGYDFWGEEFLKKADR